MADLQDLEDDIDLPEEAVASPVKRPLSRLRRKGEQLPDPGGIESELPPDKNPILDGFRVNEEDVSEGLEPDDERYSNRAKSYEEEGARVSPDQDEVFSGMEPEGSEERHIAGYSDNDDDNLPEESDEEAELARRLREGESESEGEGGGSDSDSDAGEAHRKRAREEGAEGTRDGDGSEAEAEELDFDKDRDDDEYEFPSQPDVLLKKHKRRRDGEGDIHAESQRLLRETRGVSFKPQATVQKPLSSLLEKIRKRKEELFGASNPPPERPPPVRKPLPADVLKQATAGRQRVGDASGDVSEGGPDDSDDDMVLEIVDAKKPLKVDTASPKKQELEKEETPHTDAGQHTGYDGDLEDDDDEALTFDFRKRGAEVPGEPFRPPVADTQDLFTEPEGVDGFVEEDKEEETEAAAEKAARPVFPMFQRKPVAKVPKFSEPFHMPVEDTQDLFSEPQCDDENVEPPAEAPGDPFRGTPEDAQGEGSDVEDDVMPSRMKLTMDNSKSQPIEDPWEMEGSEDGSKEDEENERGEKDDILEREMSPLRPLPSPRKSPKKKSAVSDAVRRFMDDEAEEEDSDGNLGNLSDDDEDPAAAADEMEYVIDTRAEAVIDNGEKERLALHRQWAEQQDMKDTKELLDRMKNGWQRPGAAAALMDSDDEDDLDLPPDILRRRRLAARAAARARDEAFDDYDADAAAASDEEEASDGPGSEDEEFREQVLRRRRLQESESLDPEPVDFEDDEASREVLGLLKRPTVPVAGPVTAEPHKGKGRGSLLGLFSKKNKALKSSSSFLNRASVSSPDGTGNVKTANAGSGTGRYYIFGRDDSNSGMGFDRKERPDVEGEMAPEPARPSTSQAPTNFVGIASRVGAAGPKRSAPLGAMAPSKFFGLLSKSSRTDMDTDDLPAEVPSFLREFKTVKKSAFVR